MQNPETITKTTGAARQTAVVGLQHVYVAVRQMSERTPIVVTFLVAVVTEDVVHAAVDVFGVVAKVRQQESLQDKVGGSLDLGSLQKKEVPRKVVKVGKDRHLVGS